MPPDTWGEALLSDVNYNNPLTTFRSWCKCKGCGRIGEQIWVSVQNGLCTECRNQAKGAQVKPQESLVTQATSTQLMTAQPAASEALRAQLTSAEAWFAQMGAGAGVMPIKTQADLEFAAEVVRAIKAKAKEIEATKAPLTKPLNEMLSMVRGWFKPTEKAAEKAEADWKAAVLRSNKERTEEASKALLEAQRAHVAGDDKAVAAAVARVQPPEAVAGLSIRRTWKYRIVDESRVPREYLAVDHAKVSAALAASKTPGEVIPGIEFYQEEGLASR
jgi:hypothetical protein